MVNLFNKPKIKKDELSKNKNIAKNETIIIIKRLMGNIPVTVARFKANQERDNDFNLVLINKDESNFKEDISITQNKLIDLLKYKLDLTGKTKEEKIKLIDVAISSQEKLLKQIKSEDPSLKTPNPNDSEDAITKNIIDEDYRLCTLKTLRFTVKHDGAGSYEEINEDGYKQIMFVSIDGILYPYFHSSTNVTLHPDISSKRKIHKERGDMIEADYLNENKGIFSGWFLHIMKFLIVALLVFNMWWTFDLLEARQEFDSFVDSSAFGQLLESAEGSAIKCAGYLSYQVTTNNDLIEFAKQNYNNTIEKHINDENKVDLG